MTKRKLRKHLVCQLDGCENSLEGLRSDAMYCLKHKTAHGVKPRKHHICQFELCNKSLEGMLSHAMYCPDHRGIKRRIIREFDTCQLEGCENSLVGTHKAKKYCCKEHWKEDFEIHRRTQYEYAPRHFYTCQLEGCENSLEGMNPTAKHCCPTHTKTAWARTPKGKAARIAWEESPKGIAWRESPERKAYFKTYNETPEAKARRRAYDRSAKGKATKKAYQSTPKGIAMKKAIQKKWRQTPNAKASAIKRAHQRRDQKKVIPATFTLEDWNYCLEYFDHKCAYCGVVGALHQDHFIPFASGGPYMPDNIVCACPSCNMEKHAREPEDWCTPEQYERVVNYLVQQC